VMPYAQSYRYVICAPVFRNGVIFSNFVEPYEHFKAHPSAHYTFGSKKGNTLRLFLDIYSEKTGRVISNVIFIDDTRACVENVVQVMREIDKPCLGIHIRSH
jgi:hypothetical protein